jgi:hypothetical protein
MDDMLDHLDFSTLLAAVFKQALDDYVKLQHPKNRQKKYLIEAFRSAIDMFFDEEYRLVNIKNEDGEDIALKDILKTITNSTKSTPKQVQKYLVEESIRFWDKKQINIIEIPEHLIINGYVYETHHQPGEDYIVDYNNRTISIDKMNPNEQLFMLAIMEVIFYHEDIRLSKTARQQLAKAWFRTLKVNNCFINTLQSSGSKGLKARASKQLTKVLES